MHDKVFVKEIKTILSQRLGSLSESGRITAVNVRLSPFSHVSPKTLKEAFALEVAGSNFENLTLNVQMSRVEVECGSCGEKFSVAYPVFSCSQCDSSDLKIKQGPEFFVESVETES